MGYYDGYMSSRPELPDLIYAAEHGKCVSCPKAKWVWDDATSMICGVNNDSCHFPGSSDNLSGFEALEKYRENKVYENCPVFKKSVRGEKND